MAGGTHPAFSVSTGGKHPVGKERELHSKRGVGSRLTSVGIDASSSESHPIIDLPVVLGKHSLASRDAGTGGESVLLCSII